MPPTHSVWFLGTSDFAVPSLEALLADPTFSVDLVITQPDRPAGRKQVRSASPVKVAAMKHDVKILQPENINDTSSFSILLPSASRDPFPAPDFLVVVSFGQILSQEILNTPNIAPVNLHASLLPRWRGASPIQHAILAGDAETGVTVQKIVRELDAGPVLSQEKVTLDSREIVTSLHDTLATMGAQLLIKTLTSPLRPVEQDTSRVTTCRKLKREDGRVDPATLSAEEIDRNVRGLSPWPGVTVMMDGQTLKILETALEPTMDSAVLPCAGGTVLHLVHVQPAGGKPMTGEQWERGQRSKRGK